MPPVLNKLIRSGETLGKLRERERKRKRKRERKRQRKRERERDRDRWTDIETDGESKRKKEDRDERFLCEGNVSRNIFLIYARLGNFLAPRRSAKFISPRHELVPPPISGVIIL